MDAALKQRKSRKTNRSFLRGLLLGFTAAGFPSARRRHKAALTTPHQSTVAALRRDVQTIGGDMWAAVGVERGETKRRGNPGGNAAR